MELTNTGENTMKNQVVKMTLTAIRNSTGEREEIAGDTGLKPFTKQEIADRQKWFDEVVENIQFDDFWSGKEPSHISFRVEYLKVFMETTSYAVVEGGVE